MKILYDHQIFLNQNYGGPSRYFYNLVKNISKLHSTSICAPFHINNFLENLPREIVDGFNINNFIFNNFPYRFKELITNKFFNKVNYYVQRKKISKFKPDIIHRTYFDNYKTNLPTVLTVYDLIHEKFHNLYGKDSNYRPKKAAIESADQIICISKNTLNDLKYYYDLKDKKTSVIYLASDLRDLKNGIIKKKQNDNYLLFVGKRSKYKNFDNFIKAYSLSKKLKNDFKIICFGGGKFSRDEYKLFEENSIERKKIENINGNDSRLIQLYLNAKALVYPSFYEGFGLPLVEAMSLECPVICSNNSSIPEICADAAEYFDPYNIEDITKKIIDVAYSEKRINELKAKGIKREKNFTWVKCAQETENIYKKLI